MKNGFEKKYNKLNKRYTILRERYLDLKNNPRKIVNVIEYRSKKHTLTIILGIIFLIGFFHYRHPLILLVGLLTSIVDFIYETYSVKNGVWKYKPSLFSINKIPIMIIFTYFSIGAFAVIYVLFRLGY